MPLTCECPWEDDAAWYYASPSAEMQLDTKRARRCCSCGCRLSPGDTVLCFSRWRPPRSEVEDRIYGEDGEICLAPWWMCETCGDLYWSLTELGFCITLDESMYNLVKEYVRVYGPEANHVE